MKILSTLAIGLALGLNAAPVHAQQLWDNWNTYACGLTDTASFTLDRPTRVAAIELWYSWDQNEGRVGYTLLQGGRQLARGALDRSSCDPYQQNWCGARAEVALDLAPGPVEVHVDRRAVCQNSGSGGIGFIKVFGGSQ